MAKTLDDVIKGLPLDQQQEVATQAARLIDEEMTTRDRSPAKTEKLTLSERDSLLVLDLLENPPEPSARLIRAAKAEQALDEIVAFDQEFGLL
jgi:hypothetical protein